MVIRRSIILVIALAAVAAVGAAAAPGDDSAPAVAPAEADAADVDEGVAADNEGDAADEADDDAAADSEGARAKRPPPPPVDDALRDLDAGGGMGATEMMGSFARSMLMLAVVLGLAWLTLSKGMGKLVERANAGKRVKVIERIALDARRSLFLVELDGKEILLGGGDVVRLSPQDGPVPFSSVLGQAGSKGQPSSRPAPGDSPAPPSENA